MLVMSKYLARKYSLIKTDCFKLIHNAIEVINLVLFITGGEFTQHKKNCDDK